MYEIILLTMMEGLSATEEGIYGVPGTARTIANKFINLIEWLNDRKLSYHNDGYWLLTLNGVERFLTNRELVDYIELENENF